MLVMALASTPREALSRKEIDALCQVAYELQKKLTEVLEFFPQTRFRTKRSDESGGINAQAARYLQ
jgi:hypothetical protein